MSQDMIMIFMIAILAGFILNYFCCGCRCSNSAKLSQPKEQSNYTQSAYRNGVYRQNPLKFVHPGAEERIRRRMRK